MKKNLTLYPTSAIANSAVPFLDSCTSQSISIACNISKVCSVFKMQNKKAVTTFFVGIALSVLSTFLNAKTGDTEQPMNIDSGTQALDITNNIVTFTDKVVITQGTIKINADKVTVIRPNGDQTKTIVEAFGAPLTFSQQQDDGKLIEGHSNKMKYELENELITLTGNAFLSQMDSQVSGEQITYLVKEQKMQAKSGQNQRVTTILVPNQLQDKK